MTYEFPSDGFHLLLKVFFDFLAWLFLPTGRDLDLHRIARAEYRSDTRHLERDKPFSAFVANTRQHARFFGGRGFIPAYGV